MNIDEVKSKLTDLEKQINTNEQKLNSARSKLMMDPTAKNAEEVRRLQNDAENLTTAYQSAKTLATEMQQTAQREQTKKDQKQLEEIEAQAGQVRNEILKSVKQLLDQAGALQALAENHQKLAGKFGKVGFQHKGAYKHIFALIKDVSTWERNFRSYQKNKEIGNQDKTAELTPLQKAVHAERYHDPNETPKRVRLINNESGPQSDPDNIRIG